MTFEYEVEIDASTDELWAALREREQIRRWHGWLFDGLEDEISIIYYGKATEDGHTLTVDGGDVFVVADRDGRALLKLTRAPKGGNPEWDEYYEDINEGWVTFMQQLRFALERHRGQERFTLHLAAEGDGKRAIGIASVVSGQSGERYELAVPTGDVLTGEVWFRSPHQVGLTVDGWGDGLFTAAELPPSPGHPQGAAQLVLTGYDEASFAEAARAWETWWSAGLAARG